MLKETLYALSYLKMSFYYTQVRKLIASYLYAVKTYKSVFAWYYKVLLFCDSCNCGFAILIKMFAMHLIIFH